MYSVLIYIYIYVSTHVKLKGVKIRRRVKKYEDYHSFSFIFLSLTPAVRTGLKYNGVSNYRKNTETPILISNIFFLSPSKLLKTLMSIL